MHEHSVSQVFLLSWCQEDGQGFHQILMTLPLWQNNAIWGLRSLTKRSLVTDFPFRTPRKLSGFSNDSTKIMIVYSTWTSYLNSKGSSLPLSFLQILVRYFGSENGHKLDFKRFVELILMMENRKTSQSIHFLFNFIEIFNSCYIDDFVVNMFLKGV